MENNKKPQKACNENSINFSNGLEIGQNSVQKVKTFADDLGNMFQLYKEEENSLTK